MPKAVRRIQDWAVSTSAGLLLIASFSLSLYYMLLDYISPNISYAFGTPIRCSPASNLQRRSQLGGSITLGHLIPDRSLQFPIGIDIEREPPRVASSRRLNWAVDLADFAIQDANIILSVVSSLADLPFVAGQRVVVLLVNICISAHRLEVMSP